MKENVGEDTRERVKDACTLTRYLKYLSKKRNVVIVEG